MIEFTKDERKRLRRIAEQLVCDDDGPFRFCDHDCHDGGHGCPGIGRSPDVTLRLVDAITDALVNAVVRERAGVDADGRPTRDTSEMERLLTQVTNQLQELTRARTELAEAQESYEAAAERVRRADRCAAELDAARARIAELESDVAQLADPELHWSVVSRLLDKVSR